MPVSIFLKTFWADGLSANQIAAKLGEVTRNAVIGKVHRLGLAGRATTSRQPRPRRTSPRRTGRPYWHALTAMPRNA